MVHESHTEALRGRDSAERTSTNPPETTVMEYIWLFLLPFATLAAGWFYLQRAKTRPMTTATTERPTETELADELTAS